MNDEELIGYCELHCKTERALFNDDQVNRMIVLAGYPPDYVMFVSSGWYSLHADMARLVTLAKRRRALLNGL